MVRPVYDVMAFQVSGMIDSLNRFGSEKWYRSLNWSRFEESRSMAFND